MYTYKYQRAAVTTDAIIFYRNDNKMWILLIQRGNNPFKNKWALPGGFIEIDELLEDACKRELFEETGLKIEKMHQFKAYDAIERDPRHRTISVVFYNEIENRTDVKGGDDAARASWFLINDLPELAFDHKKIIQDFIGFLSGN